MDPLRGSDAKNCNLQETYLKELKKGSSFKLLWPFVSFKIVKIFTNLKDEDFGHKCVGPNYLNVIKNIKLWRQFMFQVSVIIFEPQKTNSKGDFYHYSGLQNIHSLK